MGGMDANEAKKLGTFDPGNVRPMAPPPVEGNGGNPHNGSVSGDGPLEPDPEAERRVRARDLATLAPPLSAALDHALALMARRASGDERPIPMPWPAVAEGLGGGLWPGMHVVTGATATGKTAFALQVALNAARAGSPVLYIALELDRAQLAARLLSLVLGDRDARPVMWSDLYLGRDQAALTRAMAVAPELERLPFRIEEGPPGGWCASDLGERIQALREAYPAAPAAPLVVLDFLQLVGPTDPNGRREELRERIGAAAYAGREAARRHGAAVLLLSSVSRESGKKLWDMATGGKLGEADPAELTGLGKESGDIEFAADTVLALAREPAADDAPKGPTKMHLALAKVRAGAPRWCRLTFNGSWFSEQPRGVKA
jgi:replicative DNA helicase